MGENLKHIYENSKFVVLYDPDEHEYWVNKRFDVDTLLLVAKFDTKDHAITYADNKILE